MCVCVCVCEGAEIASSSPLLFTEALCFIILTSFQTRLTFNEVRTSTIEIQVNTGKYVIKQDEVFICELNCAVHRDLGGGMREPISADRDAA